MKLFYEKYHLPLYIKPKVNLKHKNANAIYAKAFKESIFRNTKIFIHHDSDHGLTRSRR